MNNFNTYLCPKCNVQVVVCGGGYKPCPNPECLFDPRIKCPDCGAPAIVKKQTERITVWDCSKSCGIPDMDYSEIYPEADCA